METIAMVGGTGPQGRGLALRFAAGGHPVVIGSRAAARAAEIADELRQTLADAGAAGDVRGDENVAACTAAGIVAVTVPYDGQAATLADCAQALGDKIVVHCVNALGFDAHGPYPVRVPGGSAAQEAAAALPEARLVAAFQNVPARRLAAIGEAIEMDILLCGDDADAKERVAALVRLVPGLRPVDAGALRLASAVEDLTAVLVSINRRYRTHAGVAITGLPPETR